ncbi:hypothetical protein HDU96_000588, partial [Phlyctochytrium bullatum]
MTRHSEVLKTAKLKPVRLIDRDEEGFDSRDDDDSRLGSNSDFGSNASLRQAPQHKSIPNIAFQSPTSTDPNYLPLEYTSILAYKTFLPGVIAFYVFSVLSLGILPIVAFRFPKIRIYITRRSVTSFMDAEWVLLKSHRGVLEEVPVMRIMAPTTAHNVIPSNPYSAPVAMPSSNGWTSTLSNSILAAMFGEEIDNGFHAVNLDGNPQGHGTSVFIYFEYKKQRYVYSSRAMSFVRMNGRLSMGFTHIHGLRSGMTMLDAACLLDRNGLNEINIDTVPVGVMLVDKISQPFYLFQFFSVIVWFVESYTAYAILILVTSLFSIIWEIVTAKKNEKNLRDLAGTTVSSSSSSTRPGSSSNWVPSLYAPSVSASRASILTEPSLAGAATWTSTRSINTLASAAPTVGGGISKPPRNPCLVLRDGKLVEIDSSHLVVGDAVVLEQSNTVAVADMVIVQGGVVVDESSLTGEATPVYKVPLPVVEPGGFGKTSSKPITPGSGEGYSPEKSKTSTVFAGSKIIELKPAKHVLARPGDDCCRTVGIVTATGFYSSRGELFRSILFPKDIDFKFYRDSFKFIAMLSVVAIIAFIVRLINGLRNDQPVFWVVVTSLDLITITVPPALPLILTVGIGIALQRLRSKSVFCISPDRINYAGRVDVFCWDKTGTLTMSKMTFAGIDPCSTPTPATEPATAAGRASTPSRKVSIATSRESLNGRGSAGRKSVEGPRLDGKRDCFDHVDHLNLERAVAICHTLHEVQGELLGPPLEVELFAATGWRMVEEESSLVALAGHVAGHPVVHGSGGPADEEAAAGSTDAAVAVSFQQQPVAVFLPPLTTGDDDNDDVDAGDASEPGADASHATPYALPRIVPDIVAIPPSTHDLPRDSIAATASPRPSTGKSAAGSPALPAPTSGTSLTRSSITRCGKLLVASNGGVAVLKRYEFDAQLQRCSVVFRTPAFSPPPVAGARPPKLMACVKGSPESVLRVCNPATVPRNYHECYSRYAAKGYYVLAVAERVLPPSVLAQQQQAGQAGATGAPAPGSGAAVAALKREVVERDMVFLGFVLLQNPLKPESTAVVSVLGAAGIRSVMITGDGSMTAISVSRDLGLVGNVLLVDVFAHGLGFQRLKEDLPRVLPNLDLVASPDKLLTSPSGVSKPSPGSPGKHPAGAVPVPNDSGDDWDATVSAHRGDRVATTGDSDDEADNDDADMMVSGDDESMYDSTEDLQAVGAAASVKALPEPPTLVTGSAGTAGRWSAGRHAGPTAMLAKAVSRSASQKAAAALAKSSSGEGAPSAAAGGGAGQVSKRRNKPRAQTMFTVPLKGSGDSSGDEAAVASTSRAPPGKGVGNGGGVWDAFNAMPPRTSRSLNSLASLARRYTGGGEDSDDDDGNDDANNPFRDPQRGPSQSRPRGGGGGGGGGGG